MLGLQIYEPKFSHANFRYLDINQSTYFITNKINPLVEK